MKPEWISLAVDQIAIKETLMNPSFLQNT